MSVDRLPVIRDRLLRYVLADWTVWPT